MVVIQGIKNYLKRTTIKFWITLVLLYVICISLGQLYLMYFSVATTNFLYLITWAVALFIFMYFVAPRLMHKTIPKKSNKKIKLEYNPFR